MDRDDALDAGVRVGLISYGVVHLLLAWLALQIAFGDKEGQASGSGALRQLAETEPGQLSLFVVAAGLAALVVWELFEAAVGHRDEKGLKRTGKRAVSVAKAGIFGTLGFGALRIALGSGGGSGGGTDSMTARVMSQPFGQVIVGLVGAVIIVVAGSLAYIGWTEKFIEKLSGGRSRNESRAYRWLGKVGYLSKAVAFSIVGGLFVYAAWTHDPDKSGGLDQALLQILQQPFGPVMLAAVAFGIACYGLFCFAWARHVDR